MIVPQTMIATALFQADALPDERLRVLVVGTQVAAIVGQACLGYKIEVSPHGHGALRAVHADPPDVGILQADLPDMDGQMLASMLQEVRGPKRPFLILVKTPGHDCSEDGKQPSGIHLALIRPVSLLWLRQLLRRLQAIILPDGDTSEHHVRGILHNR